MGSHEFLDALMRFCAWAKASVTSYGRTFVHNMAVNGVAWSPHLFWVGADVVYDNKPTLEVRQQAAERLGLTLIPESDHDHLQPKGWVPG